MRAWLLPALIGAVLLGGHEAGSQTVPEPPGYELERYRGPTPATLQGARVLTTAEAASIWRQGHAVFVDVLPQPPRPADLPAGTVWRDRERQDIPGSIWLPDVGYGAVAEVTERYMRAGLEQATSGDHSRLLVFYCLKDCWHSWNAAKRALAFGYANVAWYPDGTDGWTNEKLPLAKAEPAPGRPR